MRSSYVPVDVDGAGWIFCDCGSDLPGMQASYFITRHYLFSFSSVMSARVVHHISFHLNGWWYQGDAFVVWDAPATEAPVREGRAFREHPGPQVSAEDAV